MEDVYKRQVMDRAKAGEALNIAFLGGSITQGSLSSKPELCYASVSYTHLFKVKGGNFFKGLMFFPYLISGIAIGFIFKFFYTRGFVFDTILQWCGSVSYTHLLRVPGLFLNRGQRRALP